MRSIVRLKQIVAVTAVSLGTAVASHAVIDVSWAAASGFYPNGAVNDFSGLLDAAPGNQVLVQLIGTTDMTADAGLTGSTPTGDDFVLTSFILGLPGDGTAGVQAGSNYADFSAPNYQAAFVAGNFFGRIFTSAAPAPGDYHYDGPVVAFRDIAPLGTPQGYNLNIDGLDPGTFPFGGDIPTIPIVPEPGTLGLLAMGMLGLAARRRRN